MRLVYGVGINDKPGYHKTKEYKLWAGLIRRCYSEELHRKRPSYIGCEVSQNFKSFSCFYDWCQNQIGFKNSKWEIDKDVVFKGNKIYSEDTCFFVPPEINNLLNHHKAKRGIHPIGVYFEKKYSKFRAEVSVNGKKKFLGYYDSSIEAFIVYKQAREEYIKSIAENWKDKIDMRVYFGLMNYKIHIND